LYFGGKHLYILAKSLSTSNIILIAAGGVLLIYAVFQLIYILKIRKKRTKKVAPVLDDSAIKVALGGNNNILDIQINNKRVTINLKDASLVDLKALEKLEVSTQVSQNTVKLYIKDQSIIDSLK
jgi:phosphotransferase system IIB component